MSLAGSRRAHPSAGAARPIGLSQPSIRMRAVTIESFRINVDDEVLSDLQRRIGETRWPPAAPGPAWAQGTDLAYLKNLLAYWREGFDWRAEERRINDFHQFRAVVDGVAIHFIHERAVHGPGIPLVLLHGWPSTFVELLPLVTLLTDPGRHGINGPGFDVVIPSLPGYGFSERPERGNYRDIATLMALDQPESLLGIHLSNLEISPHVDEALRPLSDAETMYLKHREHWDEAERGYAAVQSTKPQTLAYSLNDSPAGLAAWIVEKWRSWADSGGDLERRFPRDLLLTMLTIYWVTESITT